MMRERVLSDVVARNEHLIPSNMKLTYKRGDILEIKRPWLFGFTKTEQVNLGTQALDDVAFEIVLETYIRSEL